jgi:3'-5' exoribonuclease
MTRARVPVVPLHALTPGQQADSFAVLAERSRGVTRDGKPYYQCRFRDAHRTVPLMVWSDSPWFTPCEQEWKDGRYYKLRVTYGEHEKYGAQIELHNIRPATDEDRAEGFDPTQLVDRSRFDPDRLLAELIGLANTEIRDEPLRRLAVGLLQKHGPKLRELPATESKFHPFAGGWLEHVVSVTHTCLRLADHYRELYGHLQPPLNRDLVVAAAMLHDIGRVVEYSSETATPQPTVPGRLFGHLILGRDLVRDAAREQGDVNAELLQLLEHIILTHLVLPEWGSPRLPLVPEVLILHHADDLDAKLEMYARCLARDQGPGPFTARDQTLGKSLLKQRTV